jgi:hypothetical protein
LDLDPRDVERIRETPYMAVFLFVPIEAQPCALAILQVETIVAVSIVQDDH